MDYASTSHSETAIEENQVGTNFSVNSSTVGTDKIDDTL